MAFTTSSNMGLTIPGIGTEYSPNWAVDLNASLTAIDSHNHSTGQGVQITANGLNINSSLPFNNNQATGLSAVLFNDVTSLATVNALYVVAGDLWYNDITGAVQITVGGLVNATSSGISSGTATAAFSGGILVVKSSATSGANVLMQSAVLTNSGNLTNQLTLQAPTLSTSFTETLPAIPGATSFMQMDASGNMSASVALSGGITGSMIASATITGSNIAAATINQSNMVAPYVAPTIQRFTSGSGTYTPPSSPRAPLYLKVTMTGGGGGGTDSTVSSGGGAGGTLCFYATSASYTYTVGAGGVNGANGTDTTFVASGPLTNTASKGSGGATSGGAGGSTTLNFGTKIFGVTGGGGSARGAYNATPNFNGGVGGNSYFGGGAQGPQQANGGNVGAAETGAGGSGAGSGSGNNGGTGGTGIIIVEEFYQ